MCSVSMVSSDFLNRWPSAVPNTWPLVPSSAAPNQSIWPAGGLLPEGLKDAELFALRREVLQLKEDLIAARKEDLANNEPDCFMEDKVTIILGLAKALGVDLEKVFEGHK